MANSSSLYSSVNEERRVYLRTQILSKSVFLTRRFTLGLPFREEESTSTSLLKVVSRVVFSVILCPAVYTCSIYLRESLFLFLSLLTTKQISLRDHMPSGLNMPWHSSQQMERSRVTSSSSWRSPVILRKQEGPKSDQVPETSTTRKKSFILTVDFLVLTNESRTRNAPFILNVEMAYSIVGSGVHHRIKDPSASSSQKGAQQRWVSKLNLTANRYVTKKNFTAWIMYERKKLRWCCFLNFAGLIARKTWGRLKRCHLSSIPVNLGAHSMNAVSS